MIEYVNPEKFKSLNLIRKHPDFVGRKALLELLEKELIVDSEEWSIFSPVKVRLLWGLGGMGKSETAVAFANDHLFDFSFIWTIDCGKDLAFEYQLLGERIGVSLQGISQEKIPERVCAFLSTNKFKQPWLLIYDNVENTFMEKDLPKRGGIVLMTSRQSNAWLQESEKQEVEPFSESEAIEILTEITGEPKSREVELLAEDLEYFPFALNQVACYIKTTYGSSVEKYRRIYSLKKQALDAPVRGDGRYEYVLKNVWETNFERVHLDSPNTLQWLELCSYLYSKNIPISWLDLWANSEAISEEVSNVLSNYALMRFDGSTKNFSIHRLVQDYVQKREEKDPHGYENAFSLLFHISEHAQRVGKDWPEKRILLTPFWGQHLDNLLRKTSWAQKIDPRKKITSLKLLCTFYDLSGELNSLLNSTFLGIEAINQDFPKWFDNEDVNLKRFVYLFLKYRYKAFSELGRFQEASETLQKQETLLLKLYGEKSIEVAQHRGNTAILLVHQARREDDRRKAEQALKIFEPLISVFEEKGDWGSLASVWTNKANAFTQLSEHERALAAQKEALLIKEKHLPRDHPKVILSRYNIGHTLLSLKKPAEAKKILEQARDDTLDKTSYLLIFIRKALGRTYGILACAAKDSKEKEILKNQAIKEYAACLKLSERHFKETCVEKADIFCDFGATLEKLDDFAESKRWYEKCLLMARQSPWSQQQENLVEEAEKALKRLS